MLPTTAKSSAIVPRMIWDHVALGPKIDQKSGFLAKTPFGAPFKIAQNRCFGLKNTPKHLKNTLKTLKHTQNILKHTPTMPGTTLVTAKQTQGSPQNSKFRKTQKFLYI